jgi:hypothetical protein
MNAISRNKFILQTLFVKLIPCFNFIFCLQVLVKFTTLFQSLHHVVLGGEFDTSHSIEIASSVPSEFLLHSRAFKTFKGHVFESHMIPADLIDAPDTAQPWPEEVASSNGTTFNVLSQGAVGDGVTDDTEVRKTT